MFHGSSFDPQQVLVMVLAGGEGKRLYPLTLDRAKPAVPFGGRYRIIDVVLSNFVNSGLTRIKVLTQYKSASLEEHIARVWRLSPMLDQFIEAIPAQQRTGKSWFKGSADAVYQCQHVIDFHIKKNAEATVAVIPVNKKEASEFGVIEVDAEGRIVGFHEKVANPPSMPGNPDKCLASMGNYVFRTKLLLDSLEADAKIEDSKHDFGANILPQLVKDGRGVYAYDFAINVVPGEDPHNIGYWRDIGTIEAYFEAQMDLIAIHPLFNLYNGRWPLRTGITHDPPAKFVFREEAQARVGIATDSLVSHGTIISGGRMHRSVVSVGVRINSFSEVEECVLFERVKIARHAKLKRCIVDKDVEIPAGAEIGYNLEADRRRFFVTDNGIVVIPKRAKLE